MSASVQITFLGMSCSPAVEAHVRHWIARLEKSFGNIKSCAAWIELPHRHNRKGNTFRVRLELAVPGDTLVVSRDSGVDASHENVYVAISDAFRAARRQLQDHAAIKRDVALHA